jgi:hypothetical protein
MPADDPAFARNMLFRAVLPTSAAEQWLDPHHSRQLRRKNVSAWAPRRPRSALSSQRMSPEAESADD